MDEGQEVVGVVYRFSTPRQERIHRRLLLVGQGPASFYKDACRLMGERVSYASTTHLVGHLLREIESGLREVLKTGTDQTTDSKGHKGSIRVILMALELPESHPVAEAWLRLGAGDEYGLHARAHRASLSEPRPINEEFIEFWNEFESILDGILDKFEDHYLIWHKQIKLLAQKNLPTIEDAKFLKNKIPNNLVAFGQFFDKLESPAWIEPLADEGLFDSPPAPDYESEKGKIGFSVWPQSRYLARMARMAPDEVLKAIVAIPNTKNFLVHIDFTEAALAMPTNVAGQLLPKMNDWIESNVSSASLPMKMGNLMERFAETGESQLAVELGRILLSVSPDPAPAVPVDTAERVFLSRRPRPRFDLWSYEQILTRNFPHVVSAAGEMAFTLLCDLLADAIELSHPVGEKNTSEDFSRVWFPAIEDHVQMGNNFKAHLTCAIRDAAEHLARKDSTSAPQLVRVLRKKRKVVFRRIAHHLLRLFPDSDFPAIRLTLLNRGMLNKGSNWHEYALLMQSSFNRLSETDKGTICRWIDNGPSIRRLRRRLEKLSSDSVTEEQIEQYVRTWKHQRVSLIANDLPESWMLRFSEFTKALPSAERLDFRAARVGGAVSRHQSPAEAEKLGTLTVKEIVDFLKEWEPSDDFMAPSREGLGRKLSSIVARDPRRFAAEAEEFQGQLPTYVRAVIDGLHDALEKNLEFDWRPVITLVNWAVSQPIEAATTTRKWEASDIDWNWTRQAAARLLSLAFESQTGGIPFSHRADVWGVLERLNGAPPLIQIVGDSFPETEPDNAGASLNADSPLPMQAVVRYACWVKRNIHESLKDGEDERNWFEQMPEVRRLLESHFESEGKHSTQVRSVFGEELPRLFELDETWISENVNRIFPNEREKRGLCNAAWTAYLFHWNPGGKLFEVLRGQYMEAVQRLDEVSSEPRHTQDPAERLAEHIILLYRWNRLQLNDALLDEFFSRATDLIRGYAMRSIGYDLYHTTDVISSTAFERLTALHDARLQQAKGSNGNVHYQFEFAAFGWWFASGKFERNWSVARLKDAIRIAGKVDVDHLVIERLAHLSREIPEESVECLRLFAEAAKNVYEIYDWQKQGRTVLGEAIKSGNTKAKTDAIAVINRLAARGYSGFIDLLDGA